MLIFHLKELEKKSKLSRDSRRKTINIRAEINKTIIILEKQNKSLLFNKIGKHLAELTKKKRQKYQITKMKVEILLLILKKIIKMITTSKCTITNWLT